MMLSDYKIKSCKNCDLCESCNSPVIGDGNFDSDIMIIGEAPGKEENLLGKPFVGRSGKLLTLILEEIGLFREKDYFITNIVKCRPPENRDPTNNEIRACTPHLIEQIEEMKPKVIVTLGRFSFNFLVPEVSITKGRGNVYRIDSIQGKKLDFTPLVLAVYHPAVALYNPKKKDIIKQDLKKIKEILAIN